MGKAANSEGPETAPSRCPANIAAGEAGFAELRAPGLPNAPSGLGAAPRPPITDHPRTPDPSPRRWFRVAGCLWLPWRATRAPAPRHPSCKSGGPTPLGTSTAGRKKSAESTEGGRPNLADIDPSELGLDHYLQMPPCGATATSRAGRAQLLLAVFGPLNSAPPRRMVPAGILIHEIRALCGRVRPTLGTSDAL